MFRIFTIEESKEWDEIVKSFCNYDIYYLSGYLKAFKIHGDGNPILIYYNREGLRGICAFMVRDISDMNWADDIHRDQYYDAVTPYGYGGWLMDGDCSKKKLELFWSGYESFMIEQKIICAFTRWCPWLNNQEILRGLSNVVDLGNTIYMDTTTVDAIIGNIKSKDRCTIRKAIKNGITVKLTNNPVYFKDFIKIYNATMLKDNAERYYFFEEEFYQSITNDLKGQWLMTVAKFEDKIIAMSLMLLCNGHMHYHLSGSVSEYKSLNATNLILYETAKYGAENGYKIFHLGGGLGSGEDTLYKFKKSFNKMGNLQFSISKDIFNHHVYDLLVNTRRNKDVSFNIESGFFPLYRAL